MDERIKKIEYYYTPYYVLEEIIKEKFDKNFSVISDLEAGNGLCYDFEVKKKELKEYEQQNLLSWMKGEYMCYMTPTLLQLLVNRDILQEGNYLINVSW